MKLVILDFGRIKKKTYIYLDQNTDSTKINHLDEYNKMFIYRSKLKGITFVNNKNIFKYFLSSLFPIQLFKIKK